MPWGDFFRSVPVWAIIAAHFCYNWGYYTLLAWLPSYFELALGLSVDKSSVLTLIPYLAMTAMTPVVRAACRSSCRNLAARLLWCSCWIGQEFTSVYSRTGEVSSLCPPCICCPVASVCPESRALVMQCATHICVAWVLMLVLFADLAGGPCGGRLGQGRHAVNSRAQAMPGHCVPGACAVHAGMRSADADHSSQWCVPAGS